MPKAGQCGCLQAITAKLLLAGFASKMARGQLCTGLVNPTKQRATPVARKWLFIFRGTAFSLA